jgi:hypothetical protein
VAGWFDDNSYSVTGNLFKKNESEAGLVEIHCPEQVLSGFRFKDAGGKIAHTHDPVL